MLLGTPEANAVSDDLVVTSQLSELLHEEFIRNADYVGERFVKRDLLIFENKHGYLPMFFSESYRNLWCCGCPGQVQHWTSGFRRIDTLAQIVDCSDRHNLPKVCPCDSP